jgi:hypothetical protein
VVSFVPCSRTNPKAFPGVLLLHQTQLNLPTKDKIRYEKGLNSMGGSGRNVVSIGRSSLIGHLLVGRLSYVDNLVVMMMWVMINMMMIEMFHHTVQKGLN